MYVIWPPSPFLNNPYQCKVRWERRKVFSWHFFTFYDVVEPMQVEWSPIRIDINEIVDKKLYERISVQILRFISVSKPIEVTQFTHSRSSLRFISVSKPIEVTQFTYSRRSLRFFSVSKPISSIFYRSYEFSFSLCEMLIFQISPKIFFQVFLFDSKKFSRYQSFKLQSYSNINTKP